MDDKRGVCGIEWIWCLWHGQADGAGRTVVCPKALCPAVMFSVCAGGHREWVGTEGEACFADIGRNLCDSRE